jgi:hypothetical protein
MSAPTKTPPTKRPAERVVLLMLGVAKWKERLVAPFPTLLHRRHVWRLRLPLTARPGRVTPPVEESPAHDPTPYAAAPGQGEDAAQPRLQGIHALAGLSLALDGEQTVTLEVCFIHPLPVLHGFPWDRHAPAWLLEPGWSPALPGEDTGAGLTKWTSSGMAKYSVDNILCWGYATQSRDVRADAWKSPTPHSDSRQGHFTAICAARVDATRHSPSDGGHQ